MKFLIPFSVLLINVVSVYSVYIKGSESDLAELEPLEEIYSAHIPRFLQPLNLSTGELKVFAGHSFQLIKAKCPAVSQERLALISKYVAKLISRNNPVPGSSPAFNDLITTISQCTDHQITDEEKDKKQEAFFHYFFHPLRNFQNLFGWDDSIDNQESETVSSTAAPTDTIEYDAEPDNQFAVPSSTVGPDSLPDAESPEQSRPFIRIFYTTSADNENDDGFAPWNPLGWLGGIFRAIRGFLSGLVGGDAAEDVAQVTPAPVAETPNAVSRVKRGVDEGPLPAVELVEFEKETTSTTTPDVPVVKGRDAFLTLIDNVCRIYCNECMGEDQVRNFKAAAKELYRLILTDSTGVELAAKHFLEPDFLQSLNEC